jgi:hypothetical protein
VADAQRAGSLRGMRKALERLLSVGEDHVPKGGDV